MAVLVVTALGVLVAREARGAGPLVAFYALWGLGSVVVYIVPSPLGDNWTRLSAFVFPVMLLTASLAGFRPRRLVVLALAAALAYNLVPYALLLPSRLDNETQKASFWRPAIRFLRAHEQPGFRVEVVPTAEHWESYWIPKAGFPLARGWYRQLDVADNPALYRNNLDANAYRSWLRSNAVRYVLLSTTTPLDWDGGPQEARVVRGPHSGLQLVFRSRNWTIYELPHATPLLTGPADPVVTSFGHTTIGGHGLRVRPLPAPRPLQPVPAPAGERLRLARPRRDDVPRPHAAGPVRAQRAGNARRARAGAFRRYRGDLRLRLASTARELDLLERVRQ